jgi:two-component system CheB/CheR fusion protein
MPAKKKETKPKAKVEPQKPQKKKSQASTRAVAKTKQAPLKTVFPIVGIGCSAGGLEALTQFLEAMPDNSGMGFVIVSHLDPNHVSLMPSLLQRNTRMKVAQVEDGMAVEPNRVYVIPPDKVMGIMAGHLQLLDPGNDPGPRAPVNYFLRNLAEDRKEKAVCIILSGMGSDGTLGLRAVKGQLGMAMVQDPDTSKYDGMPRSAISTGLADYVLPPEKMPASLLEYAKRFIFGTPPQIAPVEAMPGKALQKVHMLLRSVTGHDFSYYKENTLIRRVQRRMNVHQLERVTDYVAYLQRNPQEVRALFKELLIGVTSFFRDPEAFEVLKERALRPMLRDKPSNYTFRMWVSGCATGEEAYSLAIILQECMEELEHPFGVQIFATDIDSDAIERARQGIYSGDISADVNPVRLKKFFERKDSYQICRRIREMVIFAPQSVIKDPPFTKLDLICCRNLLIYLEADLQRKILPLFHFSLNPDGILFLGTSETVGGFGDLFSPVDNKWKIYRRKEGAASMQTMVDFPLGATQWPDRSLAHKPPKIDLAQLTERHLLEHHTPPSVLVDQKGDIAFIHGRTGAFLEPAPGAKKLYNIIEMARPGLRLELPTMIRKASTERQEIKRSDLHVKQNGTDLNVNVTVKPLVEPDAQGLLIVLFEVAPPTKSDTAGKAVGPKAHKKMDRAVDELEKELRRTKENLNTTIEELETTNEELKSTNEEYQSTNEELQSTNEELNSSKEELQSLNEELETVNAELQEKNQELTRNYNDMKNLLDSMEIPTVFLDDRLRIKRFTSHLGKIINLRESDIGRPLADFVARIHDHDLMKTASEVLETLVSQEVETRTEDGHWHMVRIRPYRTPDNVIEGVVITFMDIHRRKECEEELKRLKGLSK